MAQNLVIFKIICFKLNLAIKLGKEILLNSSPQGSPICSTLYLGLPNVDFPSMVQLTPKNMDYLPDEFLQEYENPFWDVFELSLC